MWMLASKWALSNWRTIATGLAIIAIAGIVILHFRNVQALKDDNDALNQQVSTLKSGIKTQEGTIKSYQGRFGQFEEKFQEFEQVISDAQDTASKARADVARLEGLFDEADLATLVEEDPDGASRFATGTVNDLGRMFECTTSPTDDCDRRVADAAGEGEVTTP